MTIHQNAPSARGSKVTTRQLGVLALIGVALSAACTLDNPEPGQFSGPSELGTSVELRAVPDQLVADGFSSSVIEAVVRGPDGQRRSGIEVIFDLTSPGAGAFFDLGNLAPLNGPRPTFGGVESGPVSAVSDGNGVARARYWAPFRTDQENDTVVQVTGRPAGADFNGATFRSAQIFLRAADRPSFPGSTECSFILEPHKEAYAVGEQIFFTATQITGDGGHPIARYEWDFGDGSGHVGRSAGKIYTATGTYTVTLFTTESITGTQTSCTREVLVTVNGDVPPGGGPGGGGGGPGGGGGGGGGTCGMLVVESTEVPYTTSATGANLDGPSITVTSKPDCVINDIKVEFFATAADMGASFPGRGVVRFDRPGTGPIGFDLIDVRQQKGAPLTGTTLGSSCGSLSFIEGGSDFSASASPYDGSFVPRGASLGGFDTFGDYLGSPANGSFHLYGAFLGASITFECFRITFTLADKP